MLQLKFGNRYIRRDGKISGKLELTEDHIAGCTYPKLYPFIDPITRNSYTSTGSFYEVDKKSQSDLLREYKETIEPMKVEITKDRILEAAAKCSAGKETLKTLFPEVFEDDKHLDLRYTSPECYMSVRVRGNFANKSFYLFHDYDWKLERDDDDQLCLIPTKKQ